MNFEFFKQSDWVFRIIWILTILWCLVWPLTIVASAMSLAAETKKDDYVWKFLWFLALIYPLIFVMVVKFGQNYLAPSYYWLGVAVALVPTVFAFTVIRWFLKA